MITRSEIIDRFNGRQDTTNADRNWMRKVTDVRNWYRFSASERWKVESMLMDSATLAANRSLCVTEASPVKEIPACLTDMERATCAALLSPEGIALRLEQERIPFGQIAACLRTKSG